MARKNEDRFANLMTAKVTLSAANVLTYVEVLTGISLGAGIGILIDAVEYFWDTATVAEMTADGDSLIAAWATSNRAIDLYELTDSRLIHQASLTKQYHSAVGFDFLQRPIVHQFFPPMIVATPKMYLGFDTEGLTSPGVMRSKLYFRYIELTDKEYLEIAETNLLVG